MLYLLKRILELPIHLLKQYHIYENKSEFLQNLKLR